MTFAAAEARMNASVFKCLANATATLDGVPVAGIFDNAYAVDGPEIGMASAAPAFTLPTSAVPASPVGKPLQLGAIQYAVAEHQPDGAGVSVLILERA